MQDPICTAICEIRGYESCDFMYLLFLAIL